MKINELKNKYPALNGLITQIESIPACVVVIDGDSGSGKSTFAELLSGAFDANVYHADDYFLPLDRKTPERLSEAGGNLDRERMREEITRPLSEGRNVRYRKYSCSNGTLGDYIESPNGKISIIEGVYSMHPDLCIGGAIYVVLKADPELQKKRILERNGEYILSRYEKEWLPLEKHYFSELDPAVRADFVFSVSDEGEFYEV